VIERFSGTMQEQRQRTAPVHQNKRRPGAGIWWVRSVIERFSGTMQEQRQRTAPVQSPDHLSLTRAQCKLIAGFSVAR